MDVGWPRCYLGILKKDVGGSATQQSNSYNSEWHIGRAAAHDGRCENVPCFCITLRNLMTTFDEGRIRTWRLPRRSALTMLTRASFYACISYIHNKKHIPEPRS